MINGGFFLKPSSLRKVDRRRFCGETEGVLLCLVRKPRHTEPAAKAAGEHKVKTPSPRFRGELPQRGLQKNIAIYLFPHQKEIGVYKQRTKTPIFAFCVIRLVCSSDVLDAK